MSFPFRILFVVLAAFCGGALIAITANRSLGLSHDESMTVWWVGGFFIVGAFVALMPKDNAP